MRDNATLGQTHLRVDRVEVEAVHHLARGADAVALVEVVHLAHSLGRDAQLERNGLDDRLRAARLASPERHAAPATDLNDPLRLRVSRSTHRSVGGQVGLAHIDVKLLVRDVVDRILHARTRCTLAMW